MSVQCERFLHNLPSSALSDLAIKFDKFGADGLTIEHFIPTILSSLPDDFSDNPRTVSDLREMFQQIDVDGSHSVTWEEFSNFCVDAGFVAQAGGRVTSEVSTKYVHRTAYRDRHMHVPSVRGMEIFRIEGYSILAVVEPQAPILRMYLVRSAPEGKVEEEG